MNKTEFVRKASNGVSLLLNSPTNVPYGLYGRLLLSVFTTHAVLSKEKGIPVTIEFDSMSDLLKEMQLPRQRGKNIKEQLINSRWQGDILDMPINMLTLSYRTGIILTRAGYNTLGDIVGSSESQIANINNIGKKAINEIKSEIAELGLSFKVEEHTL